MKDNTTDTAHASTYGTINDGAMNDMRRLIFGVILTVAGGVWTFVTAFSASQGFSSSLVPFFFGVLVLGVGVYLVGRFIVLQRRNAPSPHREV